MTFQARWIAARSRRWLRNCATAGDDPTLVGKPSLGPTRDELRIGHRFRLVSRPVASHMSVGPGALLQIGDDVSIGCGAAIAAFERVVIGAGTRIGPFLILMDTNFHSAPGDQSEHHDTRPVTIGTGCRIGSRVTITRGASIGDGAHILAGSVVTSAIPAGFCAAGGRARVIGRAGEVTSQGYVAAVSLPDILMQALGLASAPDLDDTVIPDHLWTDESRGGAISMIGERLGIALDVDTVRAAGCYADVAAAVQRASNPPP